MTAQRLLKSRVQYDDHGELDEVVADAGMHLEVIGDDMVFLLGYRSDGSAVAIHLHGHVSKIEEWPAYGGDA